MISDLEWMLVKKITVIFYIKYNRFADEFQFQLFIPDFC